MKRCETYFEIGSGVFKMANHVSGLTPEVQQKNVYL